MNRTKTQIFISVLSLILLCPIGLFLWNPEIEIITLPLKYQSSEQRLENQCTQNASILFQGPLKDPDGEDMDYSIHFDVPYGKAYRIYEKLSLWLYLKVVHQARLPKRRHTGHRLSFYLGSYPWPKHIRIVKACEAKPTKMNQKL